MLFKADVLERIAAGEIVSAFRLWKKPTVQKGGALRTPIGVLGIDEVMKVSRAAITDVDARRAGFVSRRELLQSLGDEGGRCLYRIDFHVAGGDPRVALRMKASMSAPEVAALIDELGKLDTKSAHGPWTCAALRMIEEKEGRTAGEISQALSIEKPTLKRKIRLLKELGLTESLKSGYRLSPRGRRVVAAIAKRAGK